MMMMKMNRLSTDREYSVSQPAKNSVPYWWPAKDPDADAEEHRQPDVDASEIETSLVEGSCGRRPMTTTSKSRTDDGDDDRGPPDPGGNVHGLTFPECRRRTRARTA